MKVNLHEEVADASEAVGDAGLGLAQPVVVWDAHVVDVLQEGVLAGEDELIQTLWAGLLHPLKAELDVDGKVLFPKEPRFKLILCLFWH